MAQEIMNVTAYWSGAPLYTAAGDTDIEIINKAIQPISFATTAGDTPPTIPPSAGSPIKSADSRAMRMLSTERLWVSCPTLSEGTSVPVTLQY